MSGGERRLQPPRGLLVWLVQHPEVLAPQLKALERRAIRAGERAGLAVSPAWAKRREFLDGRDGELQREALDRLSSGKPLPSGAWFVFEGPTSVDCYLETDRIVVVIEGKRTESGPTTSTDWMPTRHQLLRNLDAALDIARGRRVVGLFIVEGDDSGDVPEVWRASTDATISEEALDASLPHRNRDERATIRDGYLGATTWQRGCESLGLQRDLLIAELEKT
jgi:hypothetical protein